MPHTRRSNKDSYPTYSCIYARLSGCRAIFPPSSHPPGRLHPPCVLFLKTPGRRSAAPLHSSFYWAAAVFKVQHWRGPHPNLASVLWMTKLAEGNRPVKVASGQVGKAVKDGKTRDVATSFTQHMPRWERGQRKMGACVLGRSQWYKTPHLTPSPSLQIHKQIN